MVQQVSIAGSVVSLWHYPVKSMMGEELNATQVAERGLVGDRVYALIDSATGKVVSAKNPHKWARLFDFRAMFLDCPSRETVPPVRIVLPDGSVVLSTAENASQVLSSVLGRAVQLEQVVPPPPILEEYWPDLEGLPHRQTVTDETILENTFFDLAPVHLLTTATLNYLQKCFPTSRFEARRFRPNIAIAPPIPEATLLENSWIGRTLAIGENVRLKITAPCPRCVMTTLPQGDLPADLNVLKTAVHHNQGDVGVYATVAQGGTIRRGDPVWLT